MTPARPLTSQVLRTVSGIAALGLASMVVAAAAVQSPPGAPGREEGLRAFETVRAVLQNPRCQNCHIPGDAPLQGDVGRPHAMNVKRGQAGQGTPALHCGACHQERNSLTPHAPPGAPGWRLPGRSTPMVFIHLSAADLCQRLKDPAMNGGRSLADLVEHVSSDKLVGWGWDPGPGRAPIPIPRDQVVAAFKTWVAAGAPCAPRPPSNEEQR